MSQIQKSIYILGAAFASLASGAALAQRGAQPAPAPVVLPPERSVAAETTAAAVKDPKWKAPRTSWGDPSFEGQWSTDDMRGVPTVRPKELGTRESLTKDEFLERAQTQERGKTRAANEETFLRNEWGVRTFGYSSLVVAPADGQMPEMTAAGKARAGNRDRGTFGPGPFNGFDDFTLYDRCITRGIIGSTLPVIYGNGMRITQNQNSVAISYEMVHDTRVIYLDKRANVGEGVPQYMGNSRGHWDGDTLVVETQNFTDKTSIGGNGNGTRHSTALMLTETFKRVDPAMILYTATVNDPVTYTAPFTYRMMITTQPNYELYEYSCHEGNGAVGHSLSGERAFEKQVADAVAAGQKPPTRDGNVYGAPREGAEVFNINAGE
jgi:hypothetical protein